MNAGYVQLPTAIDCGLQAYFAASASATRSRQLVNALMALPGTVCVVGLDVCCYSLIDPPRATDKSSPCPLFRIFVFYRVSFILRKASDREN